MISPILNSLAARPLWRLAPMAVIALGIMLSAVAWEAADVRAAENATSQDIIQAVVGISAMVPEDARTVEHLGTMRSGNGIVIDDQGLVLTIGYLMLEASAAASPTQTACWCGRPWWPMTTTPGSGCRGPAIPWALNRCRWDRRRTWSKDRR